METQSAVDNKTNNYIQIANDNIEKVIKAIKEDNYTLSSEEVILLKELQTLIKELRTSLIINELASGIPAKTIATQYDLTPARISQIKRYGK